MQAAVRLPMWESKVREMEKYLNSQGKNLAQTMQLSAVVKKPKKEEPTR